MKELIRSIIVAVITLEARAVLMKYRPKIIVVTGSVGKTSTKDAAFTALAESVFVRKSEKGFNSDLGVPLTILGVPNGWGKPFMWARNIIEGFLLLVVATRYPRWLILEVGADRPGDISRGLSWLVPDIVILTRIPAVPVHVEYYDSPEQVFLEETWVLSRVRQGGVGVVLTDDERAMALTIPDGVRRLTYGIAHGADVRISRVRTLSKNRMPDGVQFELSYHGARAPVSLRGALGMGHTVTVAGAVAGAIAAGSTLEDATQGFSSHTPPPGRMRLVPGVKGSLIIDDSYNASPVATESALHALKDAPAGRTRIAIIADMLELGSYSADEHLAIGRVAAECANLVIAVGVRAKHIEDGVLAVGKPGVGVMWFERGDDAAAYALKVIDDGDVVLVKGSQGMRMERVVKALMSEPERAAEYLCRQDQEWLKR